MDTLALIGQRAATHDRALDAINASAARLTAQAIERGIRSYRRADKLPGLIRCDPAWLGDASEAVTAEIVERLGNAVQAAQRNIASGHWAASGSRLIALRQALAAESAALAAMREGRAA